jgi:CheY-like chemotaxis protein
MPRARQIILFVDDERPLLAVGKRRLESIGYVVQIANAPMEALSILADETHRIDLLITDFSMPGMTGLAVATTARKTRPDLPVVLLTGFMDEINDAVLKAAGVKQVLRKPVLIEELSAACSAVFATPQA